MELANVRAYVATTGIAALLILLAHVARVWAEGWHVITQPAFAFSSAFSLGLSIWALRLWRAMGEPAPPGI